VAPQDPPNDDNVILFLALKTFPKNTTAKFTLVILQVKPTWCTVYS